MRLKRQRSGDALLAESRFMHSRFNCTRLTATLLPLHARLSRALLLAFGAATPTWAAAAQVSAATQDKLTNGHAIADDCGNHEDEHDSLAQRRLAAQPVTWRALAGKPSTNREASKQETIKILGFNDFHGQLSAGRRVASRPVGSAPVLAAYFADAAKEYQNRTLIVHAGDHVGATPPESALLQDEPSIAFLNLLSNAHCRGAVEIDDPRCNVVGTLGNHEFDEGKTELQRLLYGGNHENGPFLDEPWRGARFAYISANVINRQTHLPLLPPFVVRKVGKAYVGIIGAVLQETPTIVTASGVAGLHFLDEADAINLWVKVLKFIGIKTIVVAMHQGGTQSAYTGPTLVDARPPAGAPLLDIIARLDDEVDVVVSGHAHAFTNALIANAHGTPILVTQAFSSGTAYADIELDIDLRTQNVVRKSATIVTTFADEGPGLSPDSRVIDLVTRAQAEVAPLVELEVGEAAAAITRSQNAAGESALGNLIADAQRHAMASDFAWMNPGGIRADLDAGVVRWGELFSVQPFGNSLVKMTLSGQEIYDALEQQWLGQPSARMLQVSGLTYAWNAAAPIGARIVEVRQGGALIDRSATYTVTVNSFLAGGGDNFTIFTQGRDRIGGPIDLDALVDYIEDVLPTPFVAAVEGRITN